VTRGAVTLLLAVALVGLGVARAQAQGSEADVLVAEGILALDDKQYERALELFGQALQREPDHVEALYYSAVAYMATNRVAAAVPLLERARTRAPDDAAVAFQLGIAYFTMDDFARAAPILEGLFARAPATDSLGYYVGRLRFRDGDYPAALRAFRANRTSDPNITQVNAIYTAQALARLGLSAEAESELERAQRLAPASRLTGPAERLRDSLTASRASQRRFRADVRLGGFFDDNVAVIPRRNDDADVVTARRQRHESFGELVSARGEYDWLVWGPLVSSLSYSYFATINNDLPRFDVQDHFANVDVHRTGVLGGIPYQLGARYGFEYVTLGGDELVQRHSVTGYAAAIESALHLTDGFARVEVKDYAQTHPVAAEEVQDAVNWAIGIRHTLRFSDNRHNVHVGYQFDYDDTRGRDLEYEGHRFLAGALYTLPWYGVRLAYDFDVHYRDYLHRHTQLPPGTEVSRERSDFEYTHVAAIEVPLPVPRAPGQFALRVEWIGKRADSNIPTFAYDRNTTSLYLIWQY
jgi:tetratricopeptide (TPR) repeat protein